MQYLGSRRSQYGRNIEAMESAQVIARLIEKGKDVVGQVSPYLGL